MIIILNSESKMILTASLQDDTVVPDGCEKVTVEGDFSLFEHNPCNYKYEDGTLVYVAPVVNPEDAFSAELAIGREAQVFSSSDLIRLMPYSYTLNELIRYKNFGGGVANGVPYAGLKQVLAGLVAGGMILQSDSDKLAGILLEQNIDLESY